MKKYQNLEGLELGIFLCKYMRIRGKEMKILGMKIWSDNLKMQILA